MSENKLFYFDSFFRVEKLTKVVKSKNTYQGSVLYINNFHRDEDKYCLKINLLK